jgi:EmrB/QacA subfamily drug resistance transporter
MTLAATGLGLFMLFLDAMVVNVALPDIQDSLGGGEADLQWIVAMYSLAMAVCIMSFATLCDRFGRRRVYVGALAVFVAASVACGLAVSTEMMIVARGIQGAAASASNVASLALVSAAFPDARQKGRAIGMWTAVATLGIALGPTVGGVLTETFGWRSIFLANVPVGVVALALTFRFVDESSDPTSRSFDVVGQVLFAVGVGALSYALIEAPHDGWLSPEILVIFAIAITAIVGLVVQELRHPDPMMDVRLFLDAGYLAAILLVFFALFGAYGMLLVVPQHLQNVLGYSAIGAGLVMLAFSLPAPVVSVVESHWAERSGPRHPGLVGIALVALGLGASALLIPHGVIWILPGLAALGIGLGLCIPAATAVAMTAVDADRAGMASGMLSAQRGLGSTMGFAIMGTILAAWLSYSLPGALGAIRSPQEKHQVVHAISTSANPRAYVGGLAPRRPISASQTQTKDEIIAAADDEFAEGVRLALATGAIAAVLAGLYSWRHLGRSRPVAVVEVEVDVAQP